MPPFAYAVTPYVMGEGNEASGSTTLAVTMAAASNPNDCLAALAACGSSNDPLSVSDPVNGTWSAVALPSAGTTNRCRWFYLPNSQSVAIGQQVTCTYSGTGGSKTLHVIGVPGIATASPLAFNANAAGVSPGAVANVQLPSVNTIAIALAGLTVGSAGGTPSWSGGGSSQIGTVQNPTALFSTMGFQALAIQAYLGATAFFNSGTWGMQLIGLTGQVPLPLPPASSKP